MWTRRLISRRARRMNRSIALLVVAFCGVSACKKAPQGTVVRAGPIQSRQDPQLGKADLVRDLEATILENYLQLTLGNMEAYADSVAQDREIVLIGVEPGSLVYGVNPSARANDRRPFRTRAHPTCGSDPRPLASRVSAPASSAPAPASSAPAPASSMPAPASSAPAAGSAGSEARAAVVDGLPLGFCARIVPKTLDLHLYHDGSVGWVSDELDYRVPHQGREASIPLRFTAVFVRDIDRWVLVMEHVSYALPYQRILAMASRGELERPQKMATRYQTGSPVPMLRNLVERRNSADYAAMDSFADKMSRRYQRRGQDRDSYLVDENAYLTLLPAREYRGRDMFRAPSLARTLRNGDRAVAGLKIDSYRLFVAANTAVAWMAANLVAITAVPGHGGERDRQVEIGLRATYVFALDSSGWNIVQTHVSVPVTEAQLARRIFGMPRPEKRVEQSNAELASKKEQAP